LWVRISLGLLRPPPPQKKAFILEEQERRNIFAEGMEVILEPAETGTVKPTTMRQITV